MRLLLQQFPFGLVTHWSRSSVRAARHNAMSATTACAARRTERLEVSTFISDYLAHRAG